MRHHAHHNVVTLPTERSLGTMLSDSNDDVHTLLVRTPRGMPSRTFKAAMRTGSQRFLQDENAAAIGRSSRAATAEFHDREEAHDEFTHAHFRLSACRSRPPPGD